jgi:hypothetical protein
MKLESTILGNGMAPQYISKEEEIPECHQLEKL